MPYTKNFLKLWDSVNDTYLNKPVKLKYQKEYGKKYESKEIKEIAFKIANKLHIKIE